MIKNNECSFNDMNGIYSTCLYGYNSIQNNTCNNNIDYGIKVENHVSIVNNTCSYNQRSGIYTQDLNVIDNNSCNYNYDHGLKVDGDKKIENLKEIIGFLD